MEPKASGPSPLRFEDMVLGKIGMLCLLEDRRLQEFELALS
jgi:hypothetical protein